LAVDGGDTQKDVTDKVGARAFTGWTIEKKPREYSAGSV